MGATLIKMKMKSKKVSVRELARRLDMPMTWVKRAMVHGVSCENALRDWMDAICQPQATI